ncbi:MAG: hypothetical protein QOE33_3601, partial [Acidobacteriota bacterium]|nr:hypothetical protein [Acidobacteriota bacterium]
MQLRSGHILLQAHLFRIAWAEAPDCPRCCVRKETVHHFLMVCPAYMAQRQRMANGYIGDGKIVVKCEAIEAPIQLRGDDQAIQ